MVVVTDVLVSLSSLGVLGDEFFSGSDCEFGESRSLSLSGERQAFFIQSRGA